MDKVTPVKITLFNGEGNGKRPHSPYKDGGFLFISKTVPSLRDAFLFMVQHFTLSKPLDIDAPIKSLRRMSALKEYVPDKIFNIAIDLDEIHTKENYLETIDFFKRNNYSIILGKSKGWNGKTKFTLKGIMRVNLTNREEEIKNALSLLQSELGDICKIDLSVANIVSLQAPSKSDFIVHYQEKGNILSDSNIYIKDVEQTLTQNFISYDNNVIDECIKIFTKLGYSPVNNYINDNGSINFRHPSEVKSKGGFFWFSSNPLAMNHNNKDKSISIFHLLKETEVGKDWLKHKTKEEQKNQLIKPMASQNYKKFLYINERYLDFSDTEKSKMIDEFLEDETGVFKIKSAMGSAKSVGIKLCIEKAHKRNEKVIIVSNRVSVAEDFAEKYNLMIYKNPESIYSQDSIVVQYDSLHKYNLSNYEVVIFDEFVSLLLHHRASLTDNANINAVKFKILMNKKKVLIADAFLTGYEDSFFKDRNIYAILNEYKDNINLLEYKNKEFFISTLISESTKLKKGEHISASFTSLNIMRVVETELKDRGVRVISLSSDTSQITREIIYDKFKEKTHNAFDVILFTPTLTVGVSNLNNISKHFHYDSGMSTDVISSLQMIKRSRNTKEIHYYLEERQMYFDTDINTINAAAERNINTFYNKKDKTLLIDICYDTGNLKLTPLAKYINEIEVLYNILANNHANAFRLLLEYQFENNPEIVEFQDESFNLRDKIKKVKDKIKAETIRILEEYSDIIWSPGDLDILNNKIIELNESEKAIVLFGELEKKFSKDLPRKDLTTLAELEVTSDFKFLSKLKKYNTVLKSFNNNDYAKYILSKAISNDIGSLQNKSQIQFLEYTLSLDIKNLRKWYSKNDLKKHNEGAKKFEKFLKGIGYCWRDSKLIEDTNIKKYTKFL